MYELHNEFEIIIKASMKNYPMSFRSKILRTVRRFSYRFGTNRDFEWINDYCEAHKIDNAVKIYKMKWYLRIRY